MSWPCAAIWCDTVIPVLGSGPKLRVFVYLLISTYRKARLRLIEPKSSVTSIHPEADMNGNPSNSCCDIWSLSKSLEITKVIKIHPSTTPLTWLKNNYATQNYAYFPSISLIFAFFFLLVN